MVSALIFDCFGVLTSDAWLPFKDRNFGHDPRLLEEAGNLSKLSDTGLISYNDFLKGIAKLADMPAAQARREIESNVPNEPLLDYIGHLKPDYKIGFLSNASSDVFTMLFDERHQKLFDAVVISYQIGVTKPDERAYTIAADRLGASADECVLVDDMERNCRAARDAGMQAVWYQDLAQVTNDLDKLLAHSKH